jgi:hypothetical protein
MSEKHIADAESKFRVCNINPDFCKVNGKVVPFEITRELTPERAAYASTVKARGGCKVLHIDSINKGVVGNAGQGVSSGVSQGGGDTKIIEGSKSVKVEGKLCARHLDLCDMNVKTG